MASQCVSHRRQEEDCQCCWGKQDISYKPKTCLMLSWYNYVYESNCLVWVQRSRMPYLQMVRGDVGVKHTSTATFLQMMETGPQLYLDLWAHSSSSTCHGMVLSPPFQTGYIDIPVTQRQTSIQQTWYQYLMNGYVHASGGIESLGEVKPNVPAVTAITVLVTWEYYRWDGMSSRSPPSLAQIWPCCGHDVVDHMVSVSNCSLFFHS